MSILKIVICFCALIPFYVKAVSVDELKQNYAQVIMQCANDYPLSANDIGELKAGRMPDNDVVKCLFACAYKKSGMMNEKGELSAEGIKEMSQKYFANDPELIKTSEEFLLACISVNDIVVSDGEKGCERASLIFRCSVEKAPTFGLV